MTISGSTRSPPPHIETVSGKQKNKNMEIVKIGDTNIALKYDNTNDKVLFTVLGEALTEIQCFENCIYSLLSGIQGNENENPIDDYLERNERKTLGQLIYGIDQFIEDEDVKDNLIKVRDKRNYLVHKILRKYGWPLMTDNHYLEAINEIVEIRNFINTSEPKITKYIRDNNILDILIFKLKENEK